MAIIRKSIARESDRAGSPYPPALLEQIAAARCEKPLNKARERERERRGEVLPRTRARAAKGPPAHEYMQMSPERRRWDKIARNPSEVGYVGAVKRVMGWKLRDDETWRLEDGKPEDQERLNGMEEEVRKENERRSRSDTGR